MTKAISGQPLAKNSVISRRRSFDCFLRNDYSIDENRRLTAKKIEEVKNNKGWIPRSYMS